MEALKHVLVHKASPIQHLCMRCVKNLSGYSQLLRYQRCCTAPPCFQRKGYCTAVDSVPEQKATALRGTRLVSRSLILLRGRDAGDLLQGLMTNDVELLGEDDEGLPAIFSMFLNKQGRILYDVMCYRWGGGQEGEPLSYVLECDSTISPELQKHLKIYRIRKKVDIASLDSEYHVWSVFSEEDETPAPQASSDSYLCHSHKVADPRIKGLGQRIILPHGNTLSKVAEVSEQDYQTHRYQWGVAEGVNELPPGESLPLEANLALMNGVSFTKGCYLGQELTARTHHTGVIRKRIMPVQLLRNESSVFPPGSTIKTNEGKNVGKLRCHLHQNGLALLRTALIGDKLWLSQEGKEDTELVARRPSWWPEEIKNK
ncbi:putative transferase CAF17 homolog, mitochondrial [Diadema setosum]|uniref:putative transferase CAF17 homolog, mitochondrial n=1 Tax=Diadema setosum TaxID=31175 RepID=UPI003B3A7235